MRCEIPHRCVRRKYRIRRHSPFRLRNCWEGRSVRASSLLRQLAKGGCAARRLSWVTPGFSQSRRCKTTASRPYLLLFLSLPPSFLAFLAPSLLSPPFPPFFLLSFSPSTSSSPPPPTSIPSPLFPPSFLPFLVAGFFVAVWGEVCSRVFASICVLYVGGTVGLGLVFIEGYTFLSFPNFLPISPLSPFLPSSLSPLLSLPPFSLSSPFSSPFLLLSSSFILSILFSFAPLLQAA